MRRRVEIAFVGLSYRAGERGMDRSSTFDGRERASADRRGELSVRGREGEGRRREGVEREGDEVDGLRRVGAGDVELLL